MTSYPIRGRHAGVKPHENSFINYEDSKFQFIMVLFGLAYLKSKSNGDLLYNWRHTDCGFINYNNDVDIDVNTTESLDVVS